MDVTILLWFECGRTLMSKMNIIVSFYYKDMWGPFKYSFSISTALMMVVYIFIIYGKSWINKLQRESNVDEYFCLCMRWMTIGNTVDLGWNQGKERSCHFRKSLEFSFLVGPAFCESINTTTPFYFTTNLNREFWINSALKFGSPSCPISVPLQLKKKECLLPLRLH